MSNALVPELSVSDWNASRHFYCDIIGFTVRYERAEEGFSYLAIGDAEVMIDQIGVGRDFDDGHIPRVHPFGRGVNLQIRVADVVAIRDALERHGIPILLPLEDRWYRVKGQESGNRQFVVADPDGYLLRFYKNIGVREIG